MQSEVVRLASGNPEAAVQLLGRDQACDLVRQRDPAERDAGVSARSQLAWQPHRPAHQQHQVAGPEPVLGKLLGRRLAPLRVERHERRAVGDLPLDAFEDGVEALALGPQHDALAPCGGLGLELVHLQSHVARQAALVVGAGVGQVGRHRADDDQVRARQVHFHATQPTRTGKLPTMEDTPRERHLNIHTSPEIMAGHYANFANVSHSDYEFTITFARVDHEIEADEVPGVVVSRMNMSPRFVRELIDALEDNWSKWVTREGIKNLPETQDR
jgi:hypothetical protein